MTKYIFKNVPEAIRAFIIAAIVFIGAQVATLNDIGEVEDWEQLLFSIGVGALSAAGAAALAALTRNQPA